MVDVVKAFDDYSNSVIVVQRSRTLEPTLECLEYEVDKFCLVRNSYHWCLLNFLSLLEEYQVRCLTLFDFHCIIKLRAKDSVAYCGTLPPLPMSSFVLLTIPEFHLRDVSVCKSTRNISKYQNKYDYLRYNNFHNVTYCIYLFAKVS